MANALQVDVRQAAVTRATADGTGTKGLRGLRDGSLSGADWLQVLLLEGRGYVANFGAVTTPLTFLITADKRPDAWLRVPSGVTILPLAVETVLEAAAGTATEIDIRLAHNDVGDGTSSPASVGPMNLRSDAVGGSLVTPRQLATGDVTAETSPISLHRRTFPLAQASGLTPYEDLWLPRPCPILVGPATLEVFVAATTTQATGFVIIRWIELPSTGVV